MYPFDNSHPFFLSYPAMEIYLLLLFFATLLPLSLSSSSANYKYNICATNLTCGNIEGIGYPFYDGSTRPDYCGYPGFQLDCSQTPPKIKISNNEYFFKGMGNEPDRIKVSRTDLWTNSCPDSLSDTTIDYSKFNFTSADQNITYFHNCVQSNLPSSIAVAVNCNLGGDTSLRGYYLNQTMVQDNSDMFQECVSKIDIPILALGAVTALPLQALVDAFKAGFDLSFIAENERCHTCRGYGGECGYDSDSHKFACHCVEADNDHICISPTLAKGSKSTTKSAIAGGVGIMVLAILIFISICILRKCKPIPKNQGVEDLLKNYESSALRRYTYSNVAKITNSFRVKIGEGGYGTVFKGKLEDGRIVAVKVLKKTKGNGQEFANEVVSICSTSHVNVVSLLGFCFEGHKGALLYEFMPNGSLEKSIRKRDGSQTLSTNKLFEIAVGIARGLEYLHQDCNKKIVHFDIKPHNILLDADFTPKISDFGLAKPFKQKGSIISISGARGTAGYIAPEVFFSSYGGASHKSDVYSYGMMVLEMVGCTKRMDEFESVENSSEMYFPQWIYKKLEQETRVDDGEDKEVERKMVLVGLWCIQTNPGSRPSMRGVVGMLEGEVELEVPPMPCLASPPTQLLPTNDGSVNIFSSPTHDSSYNLEISAS